MSSYVYKITNPRVPLRPIIVSVPHAGTELPLEVAAQLRPEVAAELPDTDWFIPELYTFCIELGIPMISARLSRYVVDLNRPIEGGALYTDQRRQTDALPLTTFDGEALYPLMLVPDSAERQRRIQEYYKPYHDALQGLIAKSQARSRHVLIFDAHSIRRFVPSLASEPFADMIVGDRDGTSASPILSQTLLGSLRQPPYKVDHNQTFKGGQITRGYGVPNRGVHALQLEMSQDVYMTEDRSALDQAKCQPLRVILRQALESLVEQVEKLG